MLSPARARAAQGLAFASKSSKASAYHTGIMLLNSSGSKFTFNPMQKRKTINDDPKESPSKIYDLIDKKMFIRKGKARDMSFNDFDQQLDATERVGGQTLSFTRTKNPVHNFENFDSAATPESDTRLHEPFGDIERASSFVNKAVSDLDRVEAKVVLCRLFLGIESPTEEDFSKLTKEAIEKELKYWYPSATPKLNPIREKILNLQKIHQESQRGSSGPDGESFSKRPPSSAFFTHASNFYDAFLKLEEILLMLWKIDVVDQSSTKPESFINYTKRFQKGMLTSKTPLDQGPLELLLGTKITDLQYEKFRSILYTIINHQHATIFASSFEKYLKSHSIFGDSSPSSSSGSDQVDQTSPLALLSFSRIMPDGSLQCIVSKKNVKATAKFTLGTGSLRINGLGLEEVFDRPSLRAKVIEPLSVLRLFDKYDISVTTDGNGPNATADAIKFSIARGLADLEPTDTAIVLNELGYLWRDDRMPMRHLPGRKGPRAGYTWVKR